MLVLASVALPLFFWRGTWFGTELTDAQLESFLKDREHPRRVQHALVQLTNRLEKNAPASKDFYPQVIALVDHPRAEVRSTLAWVMGWDPACDEFHDALSTLLTDDVPLVRRNAALAISKFGDGKARPILRAMLEPFAVISTRAGTLSDLPPKDRAIKAHNELARIEGSDGKTYKIFAPLNGRMQKVIKSNGSTVAVGDAICEITPGKQDMWEALRALAIVGTPDDIPSIQSALNRRYADAQVAEQGDNTIKIIEERSATAH